MERTTGVTVDHHGGNGSLRPADRSPYLFPRRRRLRAVAELAPGLDGPPALEPVLERLVDAVPDPGRAPR